MLKSLGKNGIIGLCESAMQPQSCITCYITMCFSNSNTLFVIPGGNSLSILLGKMFVNH